MPAVSAVLIVVFCVAAVVAAAVRAVGPCRRVRGQALLARVADGMREWRRSVAELDDKNKE